MTVKKLKALLAGLDEKLDDCEVIISCDAEGNRYSPFSGLDEAYCEDSNHYFIDTTYSTKWSFEDAGFDSKEEWEQFKRDNDHVIVLYPVN
jgi:hypothetical protein